MGQYGCPREIWWFEVKQRRIIRLVAVGPVICIIVQYLIAMCGRQEATSYVISGRYIRLTVPDKCVQFRAPSLNRSGELWPKADLGGIVGRFSNFW